MANKEPLSTSEEIKQPLKSARNHNVIDVEDYSASNDFDVPMYVQHTEAMLEEIDRMEEDVVEESVMDIDSADKKNPLAVVEYIDDLYCFYKKVEKTGRIPENYKCRE